MDKQIIFRVICRCIKNDIIDTCRKWNFLSDGSLQQLNLKKPKIRIAEDVYESCQEEDVDIEAAGDLDLIYSQIHSEGRKWNVCELRGQDKDHFISNPKTFRKLIMSKMKLYFDEVHVNVNMFGGALWSRVHIVDMKHPTVYKPNDVVYMVHYPKTQYVVLSRIKAKDEDNFIEALLPVFKTDEVHSLQLVGSHVSSLVELALNKHSQVRDHLESTGALRRGKIRLQENLTENVKHHLNLKKNLTSDSRDENEDEKKQRTESLDHTFGTADQPTLEKLEYKMDVKFRGTKLVPMMANKDGPFRCRIKFEGPSVLEGIRNLGKAGLASLPLPSHLAKVNSLAKNFFVIRDKSAMNKSQT
ncbi:LOW QUALITY PROTEIN: centromere protein N-like [Haliotis rubra]|uniref:LOW QUALITY PROTEIN: centromere protein N-like n=1 Tax=Haliotis rubra TaxID=36100 RepID=UPI001EE5D419|nr:LOW QUALITY PROTEIN: centromere protein N-like [Haliotis rubra]